MLSATTLSLALSFHGPAEQAQPDATKEVAQPEAPPEPDSSEIPVPAESEQSAATSGESTEPAQTTEPAESTGEEAAAPATTKTKAEGSVAEKVAVQAEAPVADEPPAPADPPPKADKPKRELALSPGVHAFLRGQGRINPGLNTDAQDIGEVLERVRVQVHGKYGPIAAFGQIQDARMWGFEDSTVANMANTDAHQAWFEVRGAKDDGKLSGFIRAGRQKLVWDNQRMIGGLEWIHTARSFDAIRLGGKASIVEADAFLAIMQAMGQVSFDDDGDPTTPALTANSDGAQLAGLRVAVAPHKAFTGAVIGLFDRADAKNDLLGFNRKIGSVGLHVFGEPVDGFHYDAEGHIQFGKVAEAAANPDTDDIDHQAWAWVAETGYQHRKKRIKPGFHVKFAMGSGHECSGDPAMGEPCGQTKNKEFFNFYHTNHLHYGLLDLNDWSNMRNIEVAAKLGFDKLLTGFVAYHFFQLHEPRGRWTNAPNQPVGSGWNIANDAHNLGHEVDVFVTLKPLPQLFLQPGYGVFVPMQAGEAIAGNDAYHFVWLWLMATFDALGK